MRLLNYLFASFFVALIFLLTCPGQAQYVSPDKILVAGQPVTLTAPNAETLIIVYRPGSNISDTVRVTMQNATYSWTPREAGIVELITPVGPVQTVSVRFDEAPVGGYIILFGAAFILFGGALFASVKLFGKETPEQIAHRPDT